MRSTADTEPKTAQANAESNHTSVDPAHRVSAPPRYHVGFLDLLKLHFMESALRRGTRGPAVNGSYLSREEMERRVALARECGFLK